MSSVAGQTVIPGSGEVGDGVRDGTGRTGRGRLRRVLHLVIATLVLMVALELVFFLLLVPRLRLTTVAVTTDLALSDAEVLTMAGLTGNEQFFSLDAAAIAARLERHLLVSEATVALRFPDTLRLTLTGRKPVVVALTSAPGDAVRAALVDSDGLVFLSGAAPWGSPDAADVPVLTGLAPEVVRHAQQLPEALHRVLADLQTLQAADPVLAALISEVRLVPVGASAAATPLDLAAVQSGFDTLLYPIGFETVLRFGSRLSAHQLAEAFVLLDLIQSRSAADMPPAIGELDLRSGTPIAVSDAPSASRTGQAAARFAVSHGVSHGE